MASLADNKQGCSDATDLLKAIAHPLRLRLVAMLCDSDEHVSGLSEKLGASQAVVSQQLRILRMRGLVDYTRERGFARYRLTEPHLRTMVNCLEDCLASRATHKNAEQ